MEEKTNYTTTEEELEENENCEHSACPFEEIDEDSFIDGIIEGSYIAGMYAALRKVGAAEETVSELLKTKMLIDHETYLKHLDIDTTLKLSDKEKTFEKEYLS